MIKRIFSFPERGQESCFLWGPRQTGKSTLLKSLFPKAPYYNLLLANEFTRLKTNPGLLGQELLAIKKNRQPVILDEIQKIPALLDEIHNLIVTHDFSFILCSSSARKLRHTGVNLLGGRALTYELFPLVSAEINDFNLVRALNHGLLPRHYISDQPKRLIKAYISAYLQEEIAAEALVRNLPAFGRFLEIAAFSNGETPVYQNIATDVGVSAPTIKEFFSILKDTLLAKECPVYRKKPKRRVYESPKFYFFDVGIANYLLNRNPISPTSESFGKAFEHLIYQELCAYSHYSGKDFPIAYWRTTSQLEVDYILGDHEVALEIKGVAETKQKHLKGLHAFHDEYKTKKSIVVSLDAKPRLLGKTLILPWQDFLSQLWSGEII